MKCRYHKYSENCQYSDSTNITIVSTSAVAILTRHYSEYWRGVRNSNQYPLSWKRLKKLDDNEY